MSIFKQEKGNFRLDVRKLFTQRMLRPWHKLPREAVDGASLQAFKARLVWALSGQIQRDVSLSTARVWKWMVFKVPSNQRHSVILLTHFKITPFALPRYSDKKKRIY